MATVVVDEAAQLVGDKKTNNIALRKDITATFSYASSMGPELMVTGQGNKDKKWVGLAKGKDERPQVVLKLHASGEAKTKKWPSEITLLVYLLYLLTRCNSLLLSHRSPTSALCGQAIKWRVMRPSFVSSTRLIKR